MIDPPSSNPRPSEPRFDSFGQVLRHRAARDPDRVLYEFFTDGDDDSLALSYHELDQRARSVAQWLIDQGATGRAGSLDSSAGDWSFSPLSLVASMPARSRFPLIHLGPIAKRLGSPKSWRTRTLVLR